MCSVTLIFLLLLELGNSNNADRLVDTAKVNLNQVTVVATVGGS
jgi:hypothetical protein